VVPCSQISAQIKAIEPYCRFPGPDDSTPLYGLQNALARKFGNVSNLDSPQKLARAEVALRAAEVAAWRRMATLCTPRSCRSISTAGWP
jgi:hypothetical protein